MTDSNTWDKVMKRMGKMSPIHKRMDASRDLAYQALYTLKDRAGIKIDGVLNVTNNRGAVFGHTIIADLITGKWQPAIEGDISGKDAYKVEQFINACLEQADEYLLTKYGIIGLHESLCNHVCIRGPIGVEFYPYIEEKEYKIHCLPLDMRQVSYQYGEWVAPITERTGEELENEYPQHRGKFADKSKLKVIDYWDKEKNELWVDEKLIAMMPNVYKQLPFVIVFPPSGFMLRDDGFLEHEGEDIFYLVRGVNDEINRTLSIEQTLLYNALRPPYEYEDDNPDPSKTALAPIEGETLVVKRGGRHTPVPTGDFNRANLISRQDLLRMQDEAAPLAPRVYTSPPSGAELLAEVEAIQRLQNSRIVALRVMREQLARLMITQFTMLTKGKSFDIGKIGRRVNFSASQLKDPERYSISFKFMLESKRQKLANLAMFSAAYGRLPLRYNLEQVLMADDPDGIIREFEIEQARKADPAIDLLEMAIRHAQQAKEVSDDIEANVLKVQSKMLTERGVAIILARKQPAELPEKAVVPSVEQPSGGGMQGLLPQLLGGGSELRGAPAAREKEGIT